MSALTDELRRVKTRLALTPDAALSAPDDPAAMTALLIRPIIVNFFTLAASLKQVSAENLEALVYQAVTLADPGLTVQETDVVAARAGFVLLAVCDPEPSADDRLTPIAEALAASQAIATTRQLLAVPSNRSSAFRRFAWNDDSSRSIIGTPSAARARRPLSLVTPPSDSLGRGRQFRSSIHHLAQH